MVSEEAKKSAKKDKKYYDEKVRHVQLMPGDRVLIRKVDKSSTSSEESSEVSERYVIPQRRNLKEKQKVKTQNRGIYDDDNTDSVQETATPVRISQHDQYSDSYSSESSQVSTHSRRDPMRRGARQKRPPLWMRTGQ